MGQDKALIPFGDRPLGAWVAERVRQVCDEVAVVGDPAKYAAWGFPMVEDIFEDSPPPTPPAWASLSRAFFTAAPT